jgi:hypothetical protein
MLDIPTATTTKGARAGTRTPEQRERFLARQPTGAWEPSTTPEAASSGSMSGPGMTSLEAQPTTPTTTAVSPWQEQYGATAEKQATGWKDPIAQQVSKDYYQQQYGNLDEYNRLMTDAPRYESGKYGGYLSPLDPMGMGNPELQYNYIKAGGQAFSPGEIENNLAITGHSGELSNYVPEASQAANTGMALPGQPYIAGTGMAAPVMNMTTGIPENPNTGLPMVSTGSSHTLSPDVINKMWR